jgi:hypothetical protein
MVDREPHTELKPVYHSVGKPSYQLGLFAFHGSAVSQSIMGLFFELAGRGFYGGNIYGSRRSLPASYPMFKSNPDTVDLREKSLREHKGCCTKRTLILRDGQIEGYQDDQADHPDWDIRTSLFRHGLGGIRSFKGGEHELFKQISQRTVYEVDLPLPLLIALHEGYKHNNGVILGSRCDNGNYPPSTRVSSGFMNLLFLNPFDALKRLNLNPDDYQVTRLVSPEKFTVVDNQLKPFPILRIDHVDLSKWKESFVSSHIKALPRVSSSSIDPLFDPSLSSHSNELDGCSDIPEESSFNISPEESHELEKLPF